MAIHRPAKLRPCSSHSLSQKTQFLNPSSMASSAPPACQHLSFTPHYYIAPQSRIRMVACAERRHQGAELDKQQQVIDMEVEREREWKGMEEGTAGEEMGNGELETRRKKGKMGIENGEVQANGEESKEKSVYFEEDQGVDTSNSAIEVKPGEDDKVVPVFDLQFGAEIFNYRNGSVEEKGNHLTNADNGSLHLTLKKKGEGKTTENENEIQEFEQRKPRESSKLTVTEYDVERVIEEQETHDLFCPNCHSCITKRVILRKRKRTQDNGSDLPPQKVRAPEASPAPEGTTRDEDETLFRCLACFSFFIPTESGFNIFRFFGKREGNNNLPGTVQIPKGDVDSSLSGSNLSKGKGEAGAPLLDQKATISSRDPSMGSKDKPQPTHLVDDANVGESTTTGENNAGSTSSSSSTSSDSCGERVAEGGKQNQPARNVSDGSSSILSDSSGELIAEGGKQTHPARNVSDGKGSKKPDSAVEPPPRRNENGYTKDNNINFLPGTDISKPGKSTPPLPNTNSKPSIGGPQTPAHVDTRIEIDTPPGEGSRRDNDWDVLKSIVYGGLIEAITSLSVVSSAAGSGSSTLNICALGLANLIGGFSIIVHDLSETRSAYDAEASNQRDVRATRYWQKLGRREHFRMHVFVALLSYIIFGLLPPIVYGFAFRESDNREYKMIAVAASSLLCIALLAIAKAHVSPQRGYIKSLFYYIGLAVPASGLAYVGGVMIDRLLVELGLFVPATAPPAPPSSLELLNLGSKSSSWAAL